MQKSENRIQERIPFQTENTPLYHRIPCRPGVMLLSSDVVLRGSLVISGGTANGTVIGENPGNLLQNLKLEGIPLDPRYPGGTLRFLSNRTILRRRSFDHPDGRFVPDQSLGVSGLTGAAGTFVLNQPFRLYSALPWLRRPFDTAVDTGMFGDLKLTILNGSRDRQFTGNDRTFSYTSVAWDIYHRFQRYDGVGNGPIAVLYDTDTQINLSGANTRLEINKQMPADGLYTDILICAEEGTPKTLVDTIINQVTVKSSTEEFYNRYSDGIRDDMEDYISEGSTAITPRTGLYWIPVADDGGLPNAKGNISLVIDQANPGTDDLLIASRRCASIPAAFLQTGKK